MDPDELSALLTPEGLRLLETVPPIRSTANLAREVSRLRAAGHPPTLVAAVVGQARLRERARDKFGPFAARMLFTRAGLEQATRLPVAALHAGRFQAAGIARVADLGCGIGGDAMAFAGLGIGVHAVDADQVTAAIAAYNLRPFGDLVTVAVDRAEASDLSLVDAVWLDPARRDATHRLGAADWSPPLEWVFETAGTRATGVKLGPGMDRRLIPDAMEAQWTSVDGTTVELVVWSGALARPGIGRAALVLRGEAVHELTAPGDSRDEPVHALGAFLHEPDGAVIRARLVGDVARMLRAGPVADGVAYLTSDAPLTTPFAAAFRVLDELPSDVKGLSRALRDRGIGVLEIKKRGVDLDPAALRPKLGLRGSLAATIVVTRIAGRRRTLLVERVGDQSRGAARSSQTAL